MGEPRRDSYIWVTWLRGLLAGDQHCVWAAWFRAHFTYRKRVDENANQLTRWKADHALLVQRRVEELRATGWAVDVEDQNKFNVRGKVATVGGVADIVARRGSDLRVEDAKTGKPRDSDYWQVVLYLGLMPLVDGRFNGRALSGAAIYAEGPAREVTAEDVRRSWPTVVDWLKAIGGDVEPARQPSASECRYCDIDECPDRHTAPELAGDTEAF